MYGPRIKLKVDGLKKVRLRPHRPEDAEPFIRMLANPEVTRYMLRDTPMSRAGEEGWIEAQSIDPTTRGWTVEVDGQCVGCVGFDDINWSNRVATVGIFIGKPKLWGRGLTTAIAQALAEHGFMIMGLRKIKSGYKAPNLPSGRVQASIGLREVGREHKESFCEGKWVDHVITELTRNEWKRAQKKSK